MSKPGKLVEVGEKGKKGKLGEEGRVGKRAEWAIGRNGQREVNEEE